MARHYSFTIQKCGEPGCTICRSPRCSPEDFEQLHRLPNPEPGEDMHYKSFEELYGKKTTENHRPSLKNTKSKRRTKRSLQGQNIQCHFVLLLLEQRMLASP